MKKNGRIRRVVGSCKAITAVALSLVLFTQLMISHVLWLSFCVLSAFQHFNRRTFFCVCFSSSLCWCETTLGISIPFTIQLVQYTKIVYLFFFVCSRDARLSLHYNTELPWCKQWAVRICWRFHDLIHVVSWISLQNINVVSCTLHSKKKRKKKQNKKFTLHGYLHFISMFFPHVLWWFFIGARVRAILDQKTKAKKKYIHT